MKKLLVLFLLSGLALTASAQKYGHLNFGNLLSLMPETKAADEALKKFQDEMVAKGDTMAKKFQQKYVAAAKEVQEGKLSPLQQQQLEESLKKEQETIVSYQQEVNQKVQAKREELLTPIIDKAEKAIADVAKTNGYVMVFDTSVFNAILFAQDADDMMPLLKTKLGIKEEPKK
ncbi:MAG: OmpH family outer membrane protein [Saprospiraceae bacterium]